MIELLVAALFFVPQEATYVRCETQYDVQLYLELQEEHPELVDRYVELNQGCEEASGEEELDDWVETDVPEIVRLWVRGDPDRPPDPDASGSWYAVELELLEVLQ